MKTVKISLADSLATFAETQAANIGFSNMNEYLVSLLKNEMQAQQRENLESKLKEGLESLNKGEWRVMTDADWEFLRQEFTEAGRLKTD